MTTKELLRLLLDGGVSQVKIKLKSGKVYNLNGAEFDVVDDEKILWLRAEPTDG